MIVLNSQENDLIKHWHLILTIENQGLWVVWIVYEILIELLWFTDQGKKQDFIIIGNLVLWEFSSMFNKDLLFCNIIEIRPTYYLVDRSDFN